MNKKVPLGVTIALIVVAITASIAITMEIAMHTYDNLIEDLPKREEMYSGLSELDDIVRKNYFGKIDRPAAQCQTFRRVYTGIRG